MQRLQGQSKELNEERTALLFEWRAWCYSNANHPAATPEAQ
jgi:hypothetical protein